MSSDKSQPGVVLGLLTKVIATVLNELIFNEGKERM